MNITYRKATVKDIDSLIKIRLDYLEDDKGCSLTNSETTAITTHLRNYIPKELGNKFITYIAEVNNEIISAVFMMIIEKPANTSFLAGKTAYVLNVFTYPDHRKKGIATKLLEMAIEDAKYMEMPYIELAASESGKPLYERLGFVRNENPKYTEMKLDLSSKPKEPNAITKEQIMNFYLRKFSKNSEGK